jgi:hypothetical protein
MRNFHAEPVAMNSNRPVALCAGNHLALDFINAAENEKEVWNSR